MENKGNLKKFWRWFAPNPLWELVRWLGGSAMIAAFGRAIKDEYYRSKPDWELIVVLFLAGLSLTLLGWWFARHRNATVPESEKSAVVDGTPALATALMQARASSDQLVECEDVRRRERTQHKSDLYRARQAYDGEREERKAAQRRAETAEGQVSIFTPLQ